ncbi:chorismate-binding protein [Candidatus Gracilibacteria bacterium]|nr:chorismate-binding protein [Candidatus Gracilibacteria bacterium]
MKLCSEETYACLLESAESHAQIGRYSFIAFSPLSVFKQDATSTTNIFDAFEKEMQGLSYESDAALPRLQCGFIGYFTYETVRYAAPVQITIHKEEQEKPEALFFLPRYVIAFDHYNKTITLIAYSEEDLNELRQRYEIALRAGVQSPELHKTARAIEPHMNATDQKRFTTMVDEAQKAISAGEVFQIVLSHQYSEKTTDTPLTVYRRLRISAPSPYMYLLQFPDHAVIGASPETLVRTENGDVVVRPIAGTRHRGSTKERDEQLAVELINDEKEQAEHMMLVDLGRNDVGTVSVPGSVRVTQHMALERFSHVMHLVSEVRGKMAPDKGLIDVFKACFPAGTLTGAPKIRAMELINKLEQRSRGVYGGAVGYFGLNNEMDFAIAIRTMLYKNSEVTLQTGAGIVYDSKPELELKECLNKARSCYSAL